MGPGHCLINLFSIGHTPWCPIYYLLPDHRCILRKTEIFEELYFKKKTDDINSG